MAILDFERNLGCCLPLAITPLDHETLVVSSEIKRTQKWAHQPAKPVYAAFWNRRAGVAYTSRALGIVSP
jgi:hypothetical protein